MQSRPSIASTTSGSDLAAPSQSMGAMVAPRVQPNPLQGLLADSQAEDLFFLSIGTDRERVKSGRRPSAAIP
jgi:hypothetical protein